jgi:fused signal recognition particle receptor
VSWFDKIKRGLLLTHDEVLLKVKKSFAAAKESDVRTGLEEALLAADLGPELVEECLKKAGGCKTWEEAREILEEELLAVFRRFPPAPEPAAFPHVVLLVGVNGSGKTTFAAKYANHLRQSGFQPLLVAADTFRAAAIEQLQVWGRRAGLPVHARAQGADPAAVVFDAAQRVKGEPKGVLVVDTAGRLHTKVNLMKEMEKMGRVLAREIPGAPHETYLVLDATTGQNGFQQARAFLEAVPVNGLVLTKLDGTAKGGIVVRIAREAGLPVRFVGVGEGLEDIAPFDPEAFVKALFE